MYSDCSHGLVPWKLLSLVLVPRERGNSRLKCLALLTEVQLGMCSDCSHGLVPWELLSQLLVPWERGKFKTEVFSAPHRGAVGHVF